MNGQLPVHNLPLNDTSYGITHQHSTFVPYQIKTKYEMQYSRCGNTTR